MLSALVIATLALSGCGKKAEETDEPVIKKQVEVQYITKQSEVNSSLSVSGTVTPKQYSVVRSLTPGTIEYLAPVGSQIVVGQPLFSKLNCILVYSTIWRIGLVNTSHLSAFGSHLQLTKTFQFLSSIFGVSARK